MTVTPSRTRLQRARRWAKDHLFRRWWDGVVTVVAGGALGWLTVNIAVWVVSGAQWGIIRANLTSFMVGRFPRDELWRVTVAVVVGATAAGLLAGRSRRQASGRRGVWRALTRVWPVIVLLLLLLSLAGTIGPWLLAAGAAAAFALGSVLGRRLPAQVRWPVTAFILLAPFVMLAIIAFFGGVTWNAWGGVLLTLFLAIGGITLSFPFGVLLALGRRSSLPAARWMSVGYIEMVRGVPLISLLFLGFVMLSLFLPPGVDAPGLVIRGVVVLTLFTAAYIAEIVRGGLQSVPRGQIEAAMALGLSPFRVTFNIVLPQALRAVIPALVGQFISLFKDTSLVAIVGLTDLLAIAQVSTQQGEFRGQGLIAETLLFASVVYWVGSYTMSRESQRLEQRLGVGQ